MTTHRLKTWPEYFRAVRSGAKPFEIRWDDRAYEVGDILELAEYDPVKGWTGEVEYRRVTFTMRDERFGVTAGYVAMGMEPVAEASVLAIGPEVSLGGLEAWHATTARQAFLKADSYRHAPFARLQECGKAAEAEAAFHAGAALLLRTVGAEPAPTT